MKNQRENDWHSLPQDHDLFGEIYLAEKSVSQEADTGRANLFPGLAVCAVGAAAAAWLSDHYGFPIILLGLLIGLSLNFISQDPRTHAGLDFAARTFLRLGIVALGLQVTLSQIGTLGAAPFLALLGVMLLAFLGAMLGAAASRQSGYAGLLAGGATAICGASAALALYSVIGKERLSQAQFALTLVSISLASALAMSIYPTIAAELELNDRAAGFLIGASVHDVAQAIGGGYAFSDEAGSYATIVKLARVAMLAPIVALASFYLGRQNAGTGRAMPIWRRLALPWFIAAFLAVLLLNSLVAIPENVSRLALTGSKILLLLAVTATAMRSRMDLLMKMGWRATVPVIAATCASFVAALIGATLLLQ